MLASTSRRILRWATAAVVLAGAANFGAESARAADVVRSLLGATGILINDHGGGSAIVIDAPNRLLLASSHAIAGATKVRVLFSIYQNGEVQVDRSTYAKTSDLWEQGLVFEGRVLDVDSRRDLAVVQLKDMPTTVRALGLAPTDASPADAVHSLSDLGGTTPMWRQVDGIVRQTTGQRVKLSDGQFLATRVLLSSLPLKVRDRGGPVVNDAGKLVAICCEQVADADQVSRCIDWQAIKEYIQTAHGLVQPQTAVDYQKIGDRYVVERNWAAADAAYRKAIGLAPANSPLRDDLAGVLAQEGNTTDATTVLEQSAAAGDKVAVAWKGAGGVAGHLGPITGPMQPDDPPKFDQSADTSVRYFRNGAIFLRNNGKLAGTAAAVSGAISNLYFNAAARYSFLGAPVSAAGPAAKSPQGTTGTSQLFDGGEIIVLGDGPMKGLVHSVWGDIWTLYNSLGGTASKLGFPTSDFTLVNGVILQTYEGGSINWNDGKDHGNVVYGDTAPPPAPPTVAAQQIYQQTLKSVVFIIDMPTGYAGTGWIVDQTNRLVVTNFHVAGKLTHPTVWFPYRDPKSGALMANLNLYIKQSAELKKNGTIIDGRTLYADASKDLAVVQVDRFPPGMAALELATAPAAKGSMIHTVANELEPNNLWNYTQGHAVATVDWRQDRSVDSWPKASMIETDMAINHGDSGGPVVNDAMKVVAVNDRGGMPTTPPLNGVIELATVNEFVQLLPGLVGPKTADDFRRIGNRFAVEQNWTSAEQSQRTALTLAPGSLPLSFDLATTLFQEGKTAEATSLLGQAATGGDPGAKVWTTMGGPQGELGQTVGNPGYSEPWADVRLFQNGAIVTWTGGTLTGQAFAIRGAIAKTYVTDFFDSVNAYGLPVAADSPAPKSPQGTSGTIQPFEAVEFVAHGDGPRQGQVFLMGGSILKLYQSLGTSGSKLGFPIASETAVTGGYRQNFEGGYVLYSNNVAKAFDNSGAAIQ